MSAAQEPIREQFTAAVVDVLTAMLAASQAWGSFPVATVERRPRLLPQLANRLRIIVLDDDGSLTPTPDNRDGAVEDQFNFVVICQVRGDDIDPPSRWGNRALDAVKRALRAGVSVSGDLWAYTKQPIEWDAEMPVHVPDGDGRFAEFILPCTARLADNLGGGAD